MTEHKYYDPQKLLSYNRVLNFVIGLRGYGKSYAWKKYPINRFIKHGEQFIYVRRYKTDLKRIGRYFDDVKQEFPDHKFEVKGYELKIDGKTAGWAIPLSMWQSVKSNAYPLVTTMVFDEFIREKDNSSYIPNEVEALLNLMDTVFRDRDNVRCVCLGNSVTVVNPYFLYFNIVPNLDKRYNAYESIVVEIPDGKDFADERRKTKFGKLIDGTNYGEMSLDNKFVNDSQTFIEPRSKNSKFKFALVYNGMTIGVWVDVQEHLMYMSHDYDPNSPNIFALNANDMSEQNMLMKNWKSNYYTLKLGRAFLKSCVRFDNQVLRNVCYEMFNKMRIQ